MLLPVTLLLLCLNSAVNGGRQQRDLRGPGGAGDVASRATDVDHVIPVVAGGDGSIANLRPGVRELQPGPPLGLVGLWSCPPGRSSAAAKPPKCRRFEEPPRRGVYVNSGFIAGQAWLPGECLPILGRSLRYRDAQAAPSPEGGPNSLGRRGHPVVWTVLHRAARSSSRNALYAE